MIQLLLFFVCALSTLAHADFSGKVIKVYDGDTITVLNDQNDSIKIRRYGIDAPEKAQAHGTPLLILILLNPFVDL